ncbi:MAG: hypothetical protein WBB28_09365 [Crinalium sp.]
MPYKVLAIIALLFLVITATPAFTGDCKKGDEGHKEGAESPHRGTGRREFRGY